MLLEKGKFKDFFKIDPEELFLMSNGRVFQSVGAAQIKTLHCTFLLILNTEKKEDFSMLNVADKMECNLYKYIAKYEGARLCTCRALYVMSRILNTMR